MSETFEQVPFDANAFVDNPEPRCPVLLLLDTSMSMAGHKINELNSGLQAFKDSLASDAMAMKRVEVGITTFGPVRLACEFRSASEFIPPVLAAEGATPMGEAITTGLQLLRERKNVIRSNGVSLYRPWVFLITDGASTDSVDAAAREIQEGEKAKGFSFYCVGVADADMTALGRLNPARKPMHLKGLGFRDMFIWLSSSLSAVSRSQPGDSVPLQNPASPEGWGEVG